MNVLCIGESILEITSVLNTPLSDGLKIKLEEKSENGAGYAGNVAYMLTKWGMDTYIASMLGSDDAAEKIKKEYESVGTRIDYLETGYDKQTGINLVLLNNTTKNNTNIKIGRDLQLKKYSFVIEPNVIFFDGTDLEASTYALDKYPNATSFLLVKENNNATQELCRYSKYLIFNEKMAEDFTNLKFDYNDSATLVNIFNKLKQKFTKSEIIITIAEKGSIYSINGQVKIMPPLKIEVIDPNGAGQVFTGALIYGIARNFGLEKALAYATIAGSLSTTKLTSRGSIPAITEVSNYYDSKFGAQNNPNNQAQQQSVEERPKEETAVNMNTTQEGENVNEQNA